MYGNGDGTFTSVPVSNYVVPDALINLVTGAPAVAADLNNDGKPDILAGNIVLLSIEAPNTSTPSGSSTALTASSTNISQGASVTLTATVTGASGSTGTPTGAVNFMLGTATLGSGSLDSSGVATFTTTQLPLGSDSITAVYSGDANFSGSTSPAFVITVSSGAAQTATTTVLTASTTATTVGSSVTLTATVTPASGTTAPTGTVTFEIGGTSIGTESLNGSGVASLSVSTLPVGTDGITAAYGGDSNYSASTSGLVSITVTLISTTTALTTSSASASVGANITFTATVTSDLGAPTGSVTFMSGSATLGTGTLNGTGVATYATSSLGAGTYSITAVYGGDTTHATSTSSPVAQTVTASSFTISFSPSSLTIKQGSTGTTTITVTPSGGFNQKVSFSCSGLPADTTCSFSPSNVTPDGTNATVTDMLTVATDVNSASLRPSDSPGRHPFASDSALLAITVFGLGGLFVRRRRLRRSGGLWWAGFIVAFAGLVGISAVNVAGCGGSSGNKTPKGTTMVSVSASSPNGNQTSTFTLVVQ